jgi:5-methyltetrahydrofolate--homocysteine methyltransferase
MAIKEIFEAVMAFDRTQTGWLVQAELDQGTQIKTILNEGLIAAMDEVGKRFSDGVFFVPEMLMAARAMKSGLEVLRPHLIATQVRPKGTVVIGTVKGDQHDIGKNLVAMMLEGAGFTVIDLGVDVDKSSFLKAAATNSADIVALSALITTTMPAMQATVAAVKKTGGKLKTMVGGAPVNQAFADRIGADSYSPDAVGAVVTARRLLAV